MENFPIILENYKLVFSKYIVPKTLPEVNPIYT